MDDRGVQKASHCGWQIHYHIVFPVKYRRGLLDEEVVGILVETAGAIAERYDMEFEQIGCDRDHIHLLCSAHPKIAPGQIVRVFKSITAREIFRRKPEVKKALWGGDRRSGRSRLRNPDLERTRDPGGDTAADHHATSLRTDTDPECAGSHSTPRR